jgi:DNA-binding IscR family transcriptional regulator
VISCIEGLEAQGEITKIPETAEAAVIQEVWGEVHQATVRVLQGYTLKDLLERRNAKQQLDIMYYI